MLAIQFCGGNTMTTKKNLKKKKKHKVFKTILFIFLSVILIGTFSLAGMVLAIIKTAPQLNVNDILSLSEPSSLYDDSGKFMDNVVTDEKRTIITSKDMPLNLKNAFVAIEDERYYSHNGLDLKRISGAFYHDVKSKLTGGNSVQGASTITQQLIKNRMFLQESRLKRLDIKRKIQEMYLATKLEKSLNKDMILEAYLNTIPLGGTANGVEAASYQYFTKSAKDLSLVECAFLAGLTQAPSKYCPLLSPAKENPSIYLNRTKTVLSKMLENKFITKAQYNDAIKEIDTKKIAFKFSYKTNSRLTYEWFDLPVIEKIREDFKSQYKYSDDEINKLLMNGGLKIYTTMNRSLQEAAQGIIDDNKNYGAASLKDKFGITQPQAAATIMDYHTGEVKVIIGGRGTQPPRSYNRAAYNGSKEFLRPSGSSIKPLTVYSAAIDSRQATAASVVEDSPLPVEIGKKYPDADGKPWNPSNYESDSFGGYTTLREGLANSINLVAIKLEYQIGLSTGATYAEKYGLTLDNDDKTSLAALSLGELHHGTNTTIMAAAYGTFGNNGQYTNPILYSKVVDRTGMVLLENKYTTRKVLSPQSAYIMYDLLKGPTSYGTATNVKNILPNMPTAGKTGTSGDFKNFWFCGLTPYYSGSVWIGDDTPKRYGKESGMGSFTSSAIWAKIMAVANKDLAVKDIQRPSGIEDAAVCMDSGKLPSDLCTKDQRGDRVHTEMFLTGTVPTDICDIHVEGKINSSNGKLATEYTPAEYVLSKIFIKRSYVPSVTLKDSAYVLPLETDDTKPSEDEATKETVSKKP